jgi:esterase/lipase superfamily enzyme
MGRKFRRRKPGFRRCWLSCTMHCRRPGWFVDWTAQGSALNVRRGAVMSLLKSIFSDRRAISALSLAMVIATGAALTACSEAPKLPAPDKSGPATTAAEPPKTDDRTAEAKQPSAPAPGAARPSPETDVKESRSAETAATEDAVRAREEAAKRLAEAQDRAQQQSMTKQTDDGYAKLGEATRPKKAAPPPTYPYIVDDPADAAGRGRPAANAPPSPAAPAGGAAPPPPPPAAVEASRPRTGATRPTEESGSSRGIVTPAPTAPATKPEAFDIVPVFYGTDRTVEPNVKRLQYGTERGHKLQLGRALITVPDSHKVPNIERPWVVEIPYFKYKVYEEKEDPKKHFTMQEVAAMTKEQLLVHVKERLAKSAKFKDHAFVFVHGFNTSFDAALYRTAQIAYDLKFDGAPFVYSWPSGGKVASYTYDRGSAEQAEPHLAEFLDIVVKESGAKSISLIAHSMGNEILLRVLERMRPAVPDGVEISQVILAAPDVDRDKFTNIARQITNFAKGVTLYAASNDRALGYSARFWGGVPRAGDVPASGPLIVAGVDTIDVTALSTDSLALNHSGYAENKTLLDDIALLLQTGERPPDKRVPILKKIESAAGVFWRYPPATP